MTGSHPVRGHDTAPRGHARPGHTPLWNLQRARTRLAVLPLPRFWGLWVVLLSAAVLSTGFYAVGSPDFSAGEFSVDQELSHGHSGILTALAMAMNYIFSPVGGFLMIAAACLFLLARNTRWAALSVVAGIAAPVVVAWSRLYIGVHYPSDVAASFLAASAAVLLFAGLWNQFQGRVLPRIALLGRFGPLSPPPAAAGHNS